MKPADSLDRHNPAGDDRAPRLDDRVPSALLPPDQIDLRPAVHAADRLRVVAPASRVRVLRPAFFAHRKFLHRGPLPVIGEAFENREARPAGRAVDERMKIAPVLRVEKLRAALVADRDVGRDENLSLLLRARSNLKCRKKRRVHLLHVHFQNHGPLRRLLLYQENELLHRIRLPLRDHLNKGALVADTARDTGLRRVPADRRPEPDPLHNAVNSDAFRHHKPVILSMRLLQRSYTTDVSCVSSPPEQIKRVCPSPLIFATACDSEWCVNCNGHKSAPARTSRTGALP